MTIDPRTSVDPRQLSQEHVDRLRTDAQAGICAATSDQEINRVRDLIGHIDAQSDEIERLTGQLASQDSVWEATCDRQAEQIRDLELRLEAAKAQRDEERRLTAELLASHETTASIAQWQDETFGPATTTWERIDRSDELMRGAMWLARCAVIYASDVQRPNLSRAIRAAEELAELIQTLVADDNDPEACVEVADIEIVLAGILARHGKERADLVSAKMKRNRARRWHVTGDGHGQHVPELEHGDGG